MAVAWLGGLKGWKAGRTAGMRTFWDEMGGVRAPSRGHTEWGLPR